jgi:hypothetical protein
MIGGEQPRLHIETGATDLAPEVQAALVQLARAYDYARDRQVDPWEFAVEIERLIGLGVTTSDLRWLVSNGYAEHAREISQSEDEGRKFQTSRNTAFTKETCFVLTDVGLLMARAEPAGPAVLPLRSGGAATPSGTASTPHWDREGRVLSVAGRIVKQYRVPSPNQEAVLAAFHEEGWPRRIDDPLPPQAEQDPKYRLHFTIHRLNQSQKQCLIRFFGDGTGEGVCWALSEGVSLTLPVAASQQKRLAA